MSDKTDKSKELPTVEADGWPVRQAEAWKAAADRLNRVAERFPGNQVVIDPDRLPGGMRESYQTNLGERPDRETPEDSTADMIPNSCQILLSTID